MSLTATFIKTTSPNNRLEKVDGGGTAIQSSTISVTLKAPTDLLRPTLLVDDFNQNEDCFDYNYVTIGFTDTHQRTRMYFITGWRIIRNNLYEVDCREDVLATYETEILAENIFVQRCAVGYETRLFDSLVPRTYYSSQYYLSLATTNTGTGLDRTFTNQSDSSAICYVIVASTGVQVQASDVGGETITNAYTQPLEKVDMSAIHPSVAVYACDQTSMEAFLDYYKKNESTLQGSLLGVYKYPFSIKDSNGNGLVEIPDATAGQMWIGGELKTISSLDGVKYYLVDERFSYSIIGNYDNPIYYAITTRINNNAVYDMFVPYYGWMRMDTAWFSVQASRYSLIYVPIWWTENCLVIFLDQTEQEVLWYGTCQIAQEISATSSNIQAVNEKYAVLAVKSTISVLTSLLGIAFGSPFGKVAGVKGLVNTAGNITETALTTHINTSANVYIPSQGLTLSQEPYIRITYTPTIESTEWINTYGRPKMAMALLSSLQQSSSDNYVKCEIDYLPTEIGNDTERAEIIRLLNQGIILPPKSST